LNFPEDDTIFLNDEPKDKLFEKDKISIDTLTKIPKK